MREGRREAGSETACTDCLVFYSGSVSSIAVVFRPVFYTGSPAAFIGVRIGMDYPGIKPYLRVEPSVSVRWVLFMVFHKEHYVSGKVSRPLGRFKNAALPVIEAASGDSGYAA